MAKIKEGKSWDAYYALPEDLEKYFGAKNQMSHVKYKRQDDIMWIWAENLRFIGDNGADALVLKPSTFIREMYDDASSGLTTCKIFFKNCYFEDVLFEGFHHHNVTFTNCHFLRGVFWKNKMIPYRPCLRERDKSFDDRRSQLYMSNCRLEGCKIEDFNFVNINGCRLHNTDLIATEDFMADVSCCWTVECIFDVMNPSFEWGRTDTNQRPPLRFWDTHLTHSKIYMKDKNLTEHSHSVNEMFKGSTDLFKTEIRERPAGTFRIVRDGLIVAGGQKVVHETVHFCENKEEQGEGRLKIEAEDDLFPISQEDNVKFYKGLWQSVSDMTKALCDPNKINPNMLYQMCSQSALKKGYYNVRDIQTDDSSGGNCGSRHCRSLSDCVYGIKGHEESEDDD